MCFTLINMSVFKITRRIKVCKRPTSCFQISETHNRREKLYIFYYPPELTSFPQLTCIPGRFPCTGEWAMTKPTRGSVLLSSASSHSPRSCDAFNVSDPKQVSWSPRRCCRHFPGSDYKSVLLTDSRTLSVSGQTQNSC